MPGYLPAPAPSVGGSDGNLQSLPSIGSPLCHHFPARVFIIFNGLSRVADDYLLAFALIGRARPNQDLFAIKVYHIYWEGLCVHLHFLIACSEANSRVGSAVCLPLTVSIH
jgi:hypothetical protein